MGYVDNEIKTLEAIVRETCDLGVEDDGLRFDATTVSGERIKEASEYEGIRLRFTGHLENVRIPMQLDVGFGDIVHPGVEDNSYPTIGFPDTPSADVSTRNGGGREV